jgi:hypothetical protein
MNKVGRMGKETRDRETEKPCSGSSIRTFSVPSEISVAKD